MLPATGSPVTLAGVLLAMEERRCAAASAPWANGVALLPGTVASAADVIADAPIQAEAADDDIDMSDTLALVPVPPKRGDTRTELRAAELLAAEFRLRDDVLALLVLASLSPRP